jgi:hypothetical protein
VNKRQIRGVQRGCNDAWVHGAIAGGCWKMRNHIFTGSTILQSALLDSLSRDLKGCA